VVGVTGNGLLSDQKSSKWVWAGARSISIMIAVIFFLRLVCEDLNRDKNTQNLEYLPLRGL